MVVFYSQIPSIVHVWLKPHIITNPNLSCQSNTHNVYIKQ